MDYQTIVEMAAAKVKAAQAILEKYPQGELPDEQKSQVDQLLRAAGEFKDQAARLEAEQGLRGKVADQYKHYFEPSRRAAGARGETGTEGPQWKSFGEWLLAVHQGQDQRLVPEEGLEGKAALAEGAGVTGGFLVPTEFRAQLLEVAGESAIVRPRATVIPMRSRSLQIPALDQTTAPSGEQSAFFGGVKAQWTEEAAQKPETEPTFKQIELVAHDLTGWLPASNALLADSAIALEALLARLFGGAVAWHEDYGFLRGDGIGKPLGVINAGATIWINRNTVTTFKFVDAVGMLAKFLTSSWGRGIWVMSQAVLPQLYQMADAASQYIWIPNAAERGPGTLLGMPIAFTEKLPALGTKGDVLLCDWSYYLVGDREGLSIASSIHERFRYNQTTWRFTERVDGQPWLDSYITLANAGTVSPFVGLDVPAG